MDERFVATAALALALGGVFGSGSSQIAAVQPVELITPVNAAAEAATLPSTTSLSIQAPEHQALDPRQVHAVSQVHAVKQAQAVKQGQAVRHGHAVKQAPAGKQWPSAKHGPVIWQEADAMDHAYLVPSHAGTLESEEAR